MNDADFAPIAIDSEDTALDHTDRCACRDCDPDAALDMAAELVSMDFHKGGRAR